MSLKEYKQKRDLKKTPEPSAGKATAGELKFVVQKHDASRLHYDLRLEANGVLKSWAVPKGPSLNPSEKRLAMMTEDHPMDYRKFEGTIPKGNYGAGEVIVWDEGEYSVPDAPSKKEAQKKIIQGLEKGDIKFILKGHKLKGEFALVKIKSDEKNSWLLIKKNDKHASEKDITQKEESVLSRKTLKSIKNNPGIDIEEAPEKKMPTEIKPMLAKTANKPFNKKGWYFEIKWDGYRAISEIRKNEVKLYSRNGNSFAKDYPSIVESLKQVNDQAILDGEIVVLNKEGVSSFQNMQLYKKSGKGNLVYYVFDILYFKGRDLTGLPLSRRKEILQKILPDLPNIKYSEHIEDKGEQFFKAAEKKNLEGIIAKESSSPYEMGARTDHWLKIKTEMRQEAVIGGYTEPRGSRKKFGSLILGVYEGKKFKYIGHTGGGFSDEQLEDMHKLLKKRERKTSPFDETPKTNATPHWVTPDLVCEVKFLQWTKSGKMRKPIFVGLREDKPAKEIAKENPTPTEAVMADKNSKANFSNLDKIFWPKQKHTKGDLIAYYDKISEFILPYLKDRPESLNRHPDGVEGKSFFQKDVDGNVPEWVETVKLKSKSKGGYVNYLVCQDKDTLLYLANLGCIEINPWNSKTGSLDKPDFAVLDIDPSKDNDFENVIEVAKTIKKVLDKGGVKSFCKTSGKTGLHVYIPMGARYTYNQVKNFSEIVAKMVNKELPEITTVERSLKKRKGRIYIDYLQNRRGQTLAAPYSLRPTDKATVSAPLKWSEVKKGLRPEDFNMENIFKRIDKIGDIWKPVLGKGIDLEKILQKLSGDS